jgi:formylglycine-generating enzyme required for sulfatase activity
VATISRITTPGSVGNLLDTATLHPGRLTGGASHPFGDVWQWTSSAYSPYPGFAPAGGAVGEYNGKFMVNQYVLRGGSWATPPGHVRATYRNFFPPAARWAVAGLRLARNT